MDKKTVLIILSIVFTFVFWGVLFRVFNKKEHKLFSKHDRKTKLIIQGILFLCVFWGLKWTGS